MIVNTTSDHKNVIVSTHLPTAHCTQNGVFVLILSYQTNSIHNTIVLKAIRLMEREAIKQTGTDVM